jgi:hypothetical protein
MGSQGAGSGDTLPPEIPGAVPCAYSAAGPAWLVPLMFLSSSWARAARALSSLIVSRKNCAMSFSPGVLRVPDVLAVVVARLQGVVLDGDEAMTLTWSLALLSAYPQDRQQLEDEVDAVLGDGPADPDRLPWTSAAAGSPAGSFPGSWSGCCGPAARMGR